MLVFTYIDGFNVYHSLVNFLEKNKHDREVNDSYKWSNLNTLVQFYLDTQDQQTSIKFFTAIPKHKEKNKINRHKKFISVLKKYCNIQVVLGRFGNKKVSFTCRNCGFEVEDIRHEEKETDVAIGIQAVHDIHTNKHNIEKIVIVSNDTDFIPVMKYILEYTEIKILLLIPLGAKKPAGEFSTLRKYNQERITIKKIKKDTMALSRMDSSLIINKQIVKSPYTSFNHKRSND